MDTRLQPVVVDKTVHIFRPYGPLPIRTWRV